MLMARHSHNAADMLQAGHGCANGNGHVPCAMGYGNVACGMWYGARAWHQVMRQVQPSLHRCWSGIVNASAYFSFPQLNICEFNVMENAIPKGCPAHMGLFRELGQRLFLR